MNNPGNFADKWSRMFHEQRDEVIPEADEVLPNEKEALLEAAKAFVDNK